MTGPRAAPLTDEQLLTALDLRENEGLSFGEIGKRFDRSKDSIGMSLNRILSALETTDPDENQNGTMPRKWWKR